jgi:aldose 1-epimerase
MRLSRALFPLLAAALFAQTTPPKLQRVESKDFGKLQDGSAVTMYTIHNAKGASVKVMSYGASLAGLEMPDRNGKFANIIAGGDTLQAYLSGQFRYQGYTVGRYANRIAGASFDLDGKTYKLQANDGGRNTLHGGNSNFGLHNWESKALAPKDHEASVEFTYHSKDGDGGFPGNLTATVTFTLTDNNELRLDYTATTDKDTPINLTNHAYFNLAGTGFVTNHELWIDADKYTPFDRSKLPTGEIADVKGTPFDFTKPSKISEHLNGTLDYNWCLNAGGKDTNPLPVVARVTEPTSGRIMEVHTDQPGLQVYTCDAPHPAMALETQNYPDAIHHANFPNAILKPGETFKKTTIYAFSAK